MHPISEDRKVLNAFIRDSSLFDGVIDFDKATTHPGAGALRDEFVVPTNGISAADRLHPNRAGYLAMAQTIDLDALVKEIAAEPRLRDCDGREPHQALMMP